MFKGILPSKRPPSVEFTMLTASTEAVDIVKENRPAASSDIRADRAIGASAGKVNHSRHRSEPRANHNGKGEATDNDFDKLLDDLQIPSTLRPKLDTMEPSVKAAMLRSSQTLGVRQSAMSGKTSPVLRRTRSIESTDSPRAQKVNIDDDRPRTSGAYNDESPCESSGIRRGRGNSFDLFRFGRSQVNLLLSGNESSSALPKPFKDEKKKEKRDKSSLRNLPPSAFREILASTPSTELEVEIVKKLRLYLRNEAASWTQDFLRAGGYGALSDRLLEILQIEWRAEQHDDQVLHELLRCFKALSTSSIGCFALRSSGSFPFAQLMILLYSDKKPGELSTRQLIVELLLILFDLYPASSLPGNRGQVEPWRSPDAKQPSNSNIVTLPAGCKTLFSFVRSLLLTPAPPPSEPLSNPITPHDFIESLHKPRIYKTYVLELNDLLRDYFWIFCHDRNTIWNLNDTDEGKVEKPRAPSGMSGGVEYEAMGYLTTHFRLINALARAACDLRLPREDEYSAYRFHQDLFSSGFERILYVARKASTTYYPTLHLEIARYVTLAAQARYDLPWSLSRHVGAPPTPLCKPGRVPLPPPSSAASPRRRGPTVALVSPALPSPKKGSPIRMC